MDNLTGCQIPCLPHFSEGKAEFEPQPLLIRVKRTLASPWNYYVKKYLKRIQRFFMKFINRSKPANPAQTKPETGIESPGLKTGDWVRVRSREEIQATLNSWKEMKGCAFLDEMWQYCGTNQRVLQSMQRFLDERDYQVKKCKGIILLDGILCRGTPVFGRCDRCCHLFWREEWLEIIPGGIPAGSEVVSN
jgi:hypothetical protein